MLESVVVAGAEDDVVAASAEDAPAAPLVASFDGAVALVAVELEDASLGVVVVVPELVASDAGVVVVFDPGVVVSVVDAVLAVDESAGVVAAEVDVVLEVVEGCEGVCTGAVYAGAAGAGDVAVVGVAPAPFESLDAVADAGGVGAGADEGSATGRPIESETVGVFANGSVADFAFGDAVAAT